jgi:mRNA-degrading endonuclease YafQ of YafQ-DinJ toxin-antitoxin module
MHIIVSAQFEKHFRKLSCALKSCAKEREGIFKSNPFHPSLKTHKLHGENRDKWAFSVNQKYRITFLFLEDGSVLFYDIGTHDEVYR